MSAGIVAHTAATEPFLQAAKPAAKPIDTTHAEQQKHALIAARAKEPRTRTANEKPAGEKPVAHKPRSDSDWASRLVFNRGG